MGSSRSDPPQRFCDWKQRHARYFLTLLGVTRSGLRELQDRKVRMRKVQVGGKAEKQKGPPGIPARAFVWEKAMELRLIKTIPLSGGRVIRHRHHVIPHYCCANCRHRKNAMWKNHAAP